MDKPRFSGKLKKWHAERGFGFIVADDGGQDVFVHISAFARDGRQPTEGEVLTFQVEPDGQGKRKAVRVRRAGDRAPQAVPRHAVRHRAASRHGKAGSAGSAGSGFLGKLISGLLVCALLGYGYSHYAKRAARYGSALPVVSEMPSERPSSASLSPAKLPVPADFKCDGRHMCSQMTSCREATLFLQNCPGMQMDGNGDGVPCEQQWCTK